MRFIQLTACQDRKSTRLNSSHTEIYTLSLHDALPIWMCSAYLIDLIPRSYPHPCRSLAMSPYAIHTVDGLSRSEEHTSELQSHRDLHSFPTRRSSDLDVQRLPYRPDSKVISAPLQVISYVPICDSYS